MFRQGQDNFVNENIFFKSAGIRVSGINQTISDNYFFESTRSPIRIMSGDSKPINPVYKPVKDLTISNNYFESSEYPSLTIGAGPKKYTVSPVDLTITDNTFNAINLNAIIDWKKTKEFDLSKTNNISKQDKKINIIDLLASKSIPVPESIRKQLK